MKQIPKMMQEFLKANDISGCMILIREEGERAILSHACYNIHDLTIVKGCATVIIKQRKGSGGSWNSLIVNAAEDILNVSTIIESEEAKKRDA